MVMRSRKGYLNDLFHLLGVTLIGFGLLAMGCAHVEPFEPPRAGEIPEGPGLFSGEKGAFVLSYHVGPRSAKTVPDDAPAAEPPTPSAAPTTPSVTPAVPAAPNRTAPPF